MVAFLLAVGLGFGFGALITGVSMVAVGVGWQLTKPPARDPYRRDCQKAQRDLLRDARLAA